MVVYEASSVTCPPWDLGGGVGGGGGGVGGE